MVEALLCRRAQRRDLRLAERAQCRAQPGMDRAFLQRPLARREERAAQMEGIGLGLEIEEARLGLFELAGGGQNIVRLARGLGHRDVDHHADIERA